MNILWCSFHVFVFSRVPYDAGVFVIGNSEAYQFFDVACFCGEFGSVVFRQEAVTLAIGVKVSGVRPACF